MKPKIVSLEIAKIEQDLLLQPRATLHRDWIEDYAADMVAGAVLPPIVVFFDGSKYWLADGFHRTLAAESASLATVAADVRPGARRDALLHSLAANSNHGHRRTNDDKRRSVDIMLADPEWVRWSDREIAARCSVSHEMVRQRRDSICQRLTDTRTVTRGGATYEMNLPQRPEPDGPTSGFFPARPPDPEPGGAAPEPYDWEASRLRDRAMGAIRTLAALPPPEVVIAAWVKSDSYGEPDETLDSAQSWLAQFARLYPLAEARRWARVQSRRGMEVHHAVG